MRETPLRFGTCMHVSMWFTSPGLMDIDGAENPRTGPTTYSVLTKVVKRSRTAGCESGPAAWVLFTVRTLSAARCSRQLLQKYALEQSRHRWLASDGKSFLSFLPVEAIVFAAGSETSQAARIAAVTSRGRSRSAFFSSARERGQGRAGQSRAVDGLRTEHGVVPAGPRPRAPCRGCDD